MNRQNLSHRRRIRVCTIILLISYGASWVCNISTLIPGYEETLPGAVCSLAVLGSWGMLITQFILYRDRIRHNRAMVFIYWIAVWTVSMALLVLNTWQIPLIFIHEIMALTLLPILAIALLTPLSGVGYFPSPMENGNTWVYLLWGCLSVVMIALEAFTFRRKIHRPR